MTDTHAEVTRCYFSWPYDAIMPEIIAEENPYTDGPGELTMAEGRVFDSRAAQMFTAMAAAVRERYPNATDLLQESTGWQGDMAQFTPRADNPDTGYNDPEYFDWLTETTDQLAARIIDADPMPEATR